MDEVKAKGESAHPDLARLATWGAAELERIDKVLSPTRNLARDPEALASVPVPSLSDMAASQSSDNSWAKVTTPRAKAFAPTARARKAGHSDIELIEDDTYDEEITALEARLAELKQRKG